MMENGFVVVIAGNGICVNLPLSGKGWGSDWERERESGATAVRKALCNGIAAFLCNSQLNRIVNLRIVWAL